VVGRTQSARLQKRSGAVEVARSDLGSGSSLVLVNEAAQDVAASDGAAVESSDRMGDRLGKLQATVWSRLVVVTVWVPKSSSTPCAWTFVVEYL
jgi:hypothetical protein